MEEDQFYHNTDTLSKFAHDFMFFYAKCNENYSVIKKTFFLSLFKYQIIILSDKFPLSYIR